MNNWLDKAEYPFRPNYLTINGQRLHYIDQGKGETIFFVHGTPSWSFEYRHLIKDLQTGYRCVAPDHIGFGLSDKPARYDYSTQNHCQTLEKFIIKKKLDLITLVVHDFGGPIGLHFALHHPEKIKCIIIMNTWLWSSQYDPDFKRIRKILNNPLLPFLYRYLNFSARYVLPASFGNRKISANIRKHYTKPFARITHRNGPLAFARSILHNQDWFESLWNKRDKLQDKPILLIWGMKDPVIGPRNLEKFQKAFTSSQTLELPNCGHFPHEEQPDEVINAIRKWMVENNTPPKKQSGKKDNRIKKPAAD